jgi:hypothetical protein
LAPIQEFNVTDFDYDSIDDIDDADDESLHVLIKDSASGAYGWHWVYRETLAEYDNGLARYGLPQYDDDE